MSDSDFHGMQANSASDAFVVAPSGVLLKEMQLFLDEGIPIDALATYKKSAALTDSALQWQVNAVNFLLEHGAMVDLRDGEDLTPLMNSCHIGKKKRSEIALRHIASGQTLMPITKVTMRRL